jgi:hypothetical protein
MNDRFRMPATSWLTSNPEHAVPIAGLRAHAPHLLNLGLCTAIETIRIIGRCKTDDEGLLKPSRISNKYDNTVVEYTEDGPFSCTVQIDVTRLSIGLLDEWEERNGVSHNE